MSVTRKMLKAMGIEDEKIEQIIEAHTETVDGLKAERDSFKLEAERLGNVQKELDDLKANAPKDYKAEYEQAKQEFEQYKESIEAEKLVAEKKQLYTDLLKAQGVDEKRLASILKLADLDALEIEDGAIKNADELAEGIKKEWADFIVQTDTKGADVSNPPTDESGAPDYENMSMAEYIKQRKTR